MRIGVILTYDNAIDPELPEWCPPGVTVHATRTGLPEDHRCVEGSREIARLDWVTFATRSLIDIDPAVVAFACTSGSFVDGPDGERRIREAILAAGAAHAVTTSGAIVEALAALGARRIAVGTPYDEPCTTALGAYLTATGHDVLSLVNDEPRPGNGLNDYTEADLEALAARAHRPDADALFLSCTALPTKAIIPRLERRYGIPVLTAVQVTMWSALQAAGAAPVVTDQRLFQAARGVPAG